MQKYLPSAGKGLFQKATLANVKRAVQVVSTVMHFFERGRFGKEQMDKQNIVRSVEKAVKT